MGWPLAVVLAVVIFGLFVLVLTVVAGKASVWTEEAKGKYGEKYRTIAADYEKLAEETRGGVKAIQSDLSTLRDKVDSIEHMMREVG